MGRRVVAVVLLLVAGCSSGARPAATPPVHAAVSTAGRAASGAGDLSGVACSSDARGVWSFHARLHNASRQAQQFTIAVALVRRQGSTVVARRSTSRQVPARGSVDVTLADVGRGSPNSVLCIPSTSVRDE